MTKQREKRNCVASETHVRSFVRSFEGTRFRVSFAFKLAFASFAVAPFAVAHSMEKGSARILFLRGFLPGCELHYALFSLRHPVSLDVVLRANARVNARFDAASLYGSALGNVFPADFHAVLSAEMIARLFPNGWIAPFRSRLYRLARRYVPCATQLRFTLAFRKRSRHVWLEQNRPRDSGSERKCFYRKLA